MTVPWPAWNGALSGTVMGVTASFTGRGQRLSRRPAESSTQKAS